MKKIFAFCFIFLLLLSGCKNNLFNTFNQNDTLQQITTNDSVVEFQIYPENSKFDCVDKFQRLGYSWLTDEEKSLYIKLDNALFNMQNGFINMGKCSKSVFSKVYLALTNDRPEYFWVPNEYVLRLSDDRLEVCFAKQDNDWIYTPAQRQTEEAIIKKELTNFLDNIVATNTEYERELIAHNWLADRVSYDNNAITNAEKNRHAWTVAGSFNQKKVVCEGYSKTFQLMCYMLGINCGIVTGQIENSDTGHMWNIVNIDNNWYFVDVTSNDSETALYHFFFNVTTEYLLKGRTFDNQFQHNSDDNLRYNYALPYCHNTTYNYHVYNSTYIANKNNLRSTVVSILYNAINNQKSMVEFAVSPQMNYISGKQDADEVFNLKECILDVNSSLPKDKQLQSYSYGGVEGALGFSISW